MIMCYPTAMHTSSAGVALVMVWTHVNTNWDKLLHK